MSRPEGYGTNANSRSAALGVSLMCAAPGFWTMATMKLSTTLLATLAGVLVIPAAAQAGTVSYEGDTLVYRADPGVRDSPMLGKDDAGLLTVSEEGMARPAHCSGALAAHCAGPGNFGQAVGNGEDWHSFAGDYPARLPVEVCGGHGRDQLQT